MMEANDIYSHVHLLSKPGDDKSDFVTSFAKPLLINRHRRTFFGLEEISIPNTITATYIQAKNKGELPELGFLCPFLTNDIVGPDRFVKLFLEQGWYSPSKICEKLNETLADKFGEKFHADICHFVFNHQSGLVEIYVNGEDPKADERCTLVIKAWLAYLLGFLAVEHKGGGTYFVFGATCKSFPKVHHKTRAFGKIAPPLSDSFDFIFVYLDCIIAQNTGHKQCYPVLCVISREEMSSSKNYLTFRPVKLQYVPVLPNIDCISSINVRIASENGIKLQLKEGGLTETRLTLHVCSEKYLT